MGANISPGEMALIEAKDRRACWRLPNCKFGVQSRVKRLFHARHYKS